MKQWMPFALAFFLILALPSIAQDKSSTLDLGSFHRVKVSDGIRLHLEKGQKESVRVEVSNADLSVVKTEVSNKTLSASIVFGKGILKDIQATVYVTYVTLGSVEATSSSLVLCDAPIKVSSFSIKAASSATVNLELHAKTISIAAASAAALEVKMPHADEVTVEASSAAAVTLKGKAAALRISAGSASKVKAYELSATEVDVKANTAADVEVNVTSELTAKAATAAIILYKGSPSKKLYTKSTTGGSIKKGV